MLCTVRYLELCCEAVYSRDLELCCVQLNTWSCVVKLMYSRDLELCCEAVYS